MKRHAALVPLSRQHHDGLALCVFIERDLREGADPAVAERLRKQALDAWELELSGHFAVEEEVLFPGVREAIPCPDAVDRLVREHDEIRAEISCLESTGASQLTARLRSLRERLVKHIRFEERVLFEAVQDSVSEAVMEDLGRRIDEMLPKVCVNLGSADKSSRARS